MDCSRPCTVEVEAVEGYTLPRTEEAVAVEAEEEEEEEGGEEEAEWGTCPPAPG